VSYKLYNDVSFEVSDVLTRSYSTSFSLAIKVFNPELRASINSIYGFVRLTDEIVDSFHEYNKQMFLNEMRQDVLRGIKNKISINPVINSFQSTVNKYNIPIDYIHDFIDSMEMDLSNSYYEREKYDEYIYGSAEVVGLMCLKVFCGSDEELFKRLIKPACALGSAFQKVNFLRDMKSDLKERGRIYLPGVSDEKKINGEGKAVLEKEIEEEFELSLTGIRKLPNGSRLGVYSAYLYYFMLFNKIRRMDLNYILTHRVRISNISKISLLFRSMIRVKFTKVLE